MSNNEEFSNATASDVTHSSLADDPPLIFVWVGGQQPHYALDSLRNARSVHSGRVIYLSPESPNIKGVEWVDEGTIPRHSFFRFRDQFTLDRTHRNDLWLRAYERFFIAFSYCNREGIERGLLAELDALILNTSVLVASLDASPRQIFAPRANETAIVATLVYWKSLNSFSSLIRHFETHGQNQNEMESLSSFFGTNQADASMMASEYSFMSGFDSEIWPDNMSETVIVDAAGLGGWLFGGNPERVQDWVWNKSRTVATSKWEMSEIEFRFINNQLETKFPIDDQWRIVAALHVPSKLHGLFTNRRRFRLIVGLARLPFRVPLRFGAGPILEKLLKNQIALLAPSRRLPLAVKRNIAGLAFWLSTKIDFGLSNKSRENLLSSVFPELDRKNLLKKTLYVLISRTDIPGQNADVSALPDADPDFLYLMNSSGKLSKLAPIASALKLGVEKYGFKTPEARHALESDTDSWPILLSRAFPEHLILLTDRGGDALGGIFRFMKKHRIGIVTPEKNLGSLRQAKFLNSSLSSLPSWNFSPSPQIYDGEILQRLFPSRREVRVYWENGRKGYYQTRLSDFYFVALFQRLNLRFRALPIAK